MAGLAVAVGLATVAALVTSTVTDADPPVPGDPQVAVDLPPAEPEPTARDFQRPEVACAPAGCVRWSVEVGHGRTSTLAHGVYHVTRDAIIALDADDGRIRWRADLLRPGARLLDDTLPPAAVADPLVLATDPQGLQAWDVDTGALRWDVAWPEGTRVAGAGMTPSQVLVATSGVLPTLVDGAFDLGTEGESPAGPRGEGVVAVGAGSGQPLWVREVDRVVALVPQVLALTNEGDLVALDPATGEVRWGHPAVTASVDPDGDEVAVADAGGVTILHAATGTVRDRLRVDLEEALAGIPATPLRLDTSAGVRVELHDRLVSVGAVGRDAAGQPVTDVWELTLYDRADGTELRRYPRAAAWWRSDDGLLLVLAAGDDALHLDAVSTSDLSEVWSRGLDAAATSRVRLEDQPREELLLSVAEERDDVEVLSVDPRTGQEVGRYGGAGWETVGDGILAFGVRQPVVGSIYTARLAGPQGSVSFTREVTIVSLEPMLVRYWDHLIRIDERLLHGGRPPG